MTQDDCPGRKVERAGTADSDGSCADRRKMIGVVSSTCGTMSATTPSTSENREFPMSRKKAMRQVREALVDADLVALPRSLKRADLVEGYVVAIGTRWVVLATMGDGGPDGWSLVRCADVRGVWEARGKRFTRRVFELEGCWPPAAPVAPLALDGTVQELIESAAAAFPLVAVYVEDEYACQIGRPVRWTSKWMYWRDLDTDAEWVPALHRYRQSDIIRVDLGGHYEASLARVAGLTPEPTRCADCRRA